MRDLLLMQLAFNILILSALLMLAMSRVRRRKPRPQAGVPVRDPETTGGQAKRALKKTAFKKVTPNSKPSAGPVRLDSLIERAEQQELVAEQDLRARLSRFKARAAG